MAKPELEQLTKALKETAKPVSADASQIIHPEDQAAPPEAKAQTSPEAEQKTADVEKVKAEAKAEAWREWQSKYDSLASRVDKAEKHLKAKEEAESQAEAQKRIDAEYAKFMESGEDPDTVTSLKDKAKQVRAKELELVAKGKAHNEAVIGFEAERDTANATKAILSKLAPDHAAILAEAVPYLVKVSKGDPEVMAELAEVAIARSKNKAPAKPADETPVIEESKRPDTSYHSALRGANVDSLSPIAKVVRGLERPQKKR